MEKYSLDCVENYKRVLERVQAAALKSGRTPEEVRLMAVTKTVAAPPIAAVISAGGTLIGENRVQELQQKKDELAHLEKEAHLIGHLQTNKAKYLPGLVTTIQSVDSLKVASAISKAFDNAGETCECYVEVNIGGEESKSGTRPQELEALVREMASLPSIKVTGLMTIPPRCGGDELRGYFQRMYKLYVDIKAQKIDNTDIKNLSMGMSGDFEMAISEGATIVRVGSAIFGERAYV